MPGLSLRQRECVLCGTAIQNAGRIDRIYCSASCRTLAWRTRIGRRPQQVRPAIESNPHLADLAQLVTRIEAVLSAAQDHMPRPEPQRVLGAGTSRGPSNTALAAELASVRAELAKQREQHVQREAELLEKNEELQAELADSQRRHEAAENANREQENTIRQIKNQLVHAQAKRDPSNEQARRIRELSAQNAALQREVQKLSDKLDQAKARTPKSDPLRFLMERKVKLLHDIAITNDRIDVHVPGRRLPDDSPKTFQAAVDYAVREVRQHFYESGSRFSSAMSWIEEGCLLDPVSEEKLRVDEERTVGNLEYALSVARRKLQ